MAVLDLNGRRCEIPDTVIAAARDAAVARAASSSQLRDLSLILDTALTGRVVALRRGEVRVLRDLATGADIPALLDLLPQ